MMLGHWVLTIREKVDNVTLVIYKFVSPFLRDAMPSQYGMDFCCTFVTAHILGDLQMFEPNRAGERF